MGIKGQKINPVGWRLGSYRKWRTLWVEESWNYGLMLQKTLRLHELVNSFLLYKRFSSINMNTTLINQGLEYFVLVIYFYNLRDDEFIKSRLNRNRRSLWKFEQDFYFKFLNIQNKKQAKNFKIQGGKLKSYTLLQSHLLRKFFLKKFFKQRKVRDQIVIFNNNVQKITQNLMKSFPLIKKVINPLKFMIFLKKIGLSINTITLGWSLLLLKKKNYQFFEIFKNFNFGTIFNFYNKNIINYSALVQSFKMKNKYLYQSWIRKTQNFKRLQQVSKLSMVEKSSLVLANLNKYSLIEIKKNIKKRLSKKKKLSFFIVQKLIGIRLSSIFNKLKYPHYKNKAGVWWKFIIEPLLSKLGIKIRRSWSLYRVYTRSLEKFVSLISSRLHRDPKKIKKVLDNSNVKQKIIKKKQKIDLGKSTGFLSNYKTWFASTLSLNDRKNYYSIFHLKKSLEVILNSKLQIFFINNLSFLKYKTRSFDISLEFSRNYGQKFKLQEHRFKKINAKRQYQKLLKEPQRIANRGGKRGPFLKDFVFLVLLSISLRQFLPLLRFISFQVKIVSKTKKQIPFLRFLIRLVTNLSGTFTKIKGLRLQFKGRFDRWKRTKSLIFTSGNIPFQKKSKDVEYSSTHGLVKKGVYGIRFWIWYGSTFHKDYNQAFLSYWYFKQS